MRQESRTFRITKYYIHRIFPKHHDSFKVAVSVFIGVFIGILPTLGIALFLTVAVAAFFRVPKIPGLLASFIAIPPTLFLFFYPLGYALGLYLLKPPPANLKFLERISRLTLGNFSAEVQLLWTMARDHVLAFSLGIFLVALLFASLSFVTSYYAVEYRRALHARYRALKIKHHLMRKT